MKIYCLFEQSGTFKGVCQDLGYEAYDIDIKNDFGKTDFKVDLFAEIANEINIMQVKKRNDKILYCNTIFDKITPNDLIFAFFPCTRFVEKNSVNAKCQNISMKNYTPLQKLEYTKRIGNEIAYYYATLCNLITICYERNLKMILENPYNVGGNNYLQTYFPFKPQVIIRDRTQMGDNYKKPTAFWFFNCEPKRMVTLLPCYNIKHKIMRNDNASLKRHNQKRLSQVEKSLITPEFAKNFIKAYVAME